MIFLSLLTTVVLGALSAQARVVTNFGKCSHFFYNNQEPNGMDHNSKKICQMYVHDESYIFENYQNYFFATLYSTWNRIPVYSAYMFNNPSEVSKEERNCKRPSKWFIEPQLSGIKRPSMMKENNFDPASIKRNQAINADYSNTGFDRGHLNPKAFQWGDGQKATFTLTNAVPMDPIFNQVTWRAWEDGLRRLLSNLDTQVEATAYLVTGAVPSQNNRIPQGAQINEEDTTERVNVPAHIWTALCYKHIDDKRSFSLGFIGENKPDGVVTLMTVEDLNNKLGVLYESDPASNLQIFTDNCFPSSEKSEKVRELSAKIGVPQEERLIMLLNIFAETQSQGSTRKHTASYAKEAFFFQQNEIRKKLTGNVCIKSKVLGVRWDIKYDLRKRDLEQSPKTIECELVPEKSNPSVKIAADGTQCSSGLSYCQTEDEFKLYCTTPCVYEETSKGYRCWSGQNSIECSPQYSRVTAKGEKCKDDYPCATYGENYYWCYTGWMSWDYCSPPLAETKTINGQACRSNYACAKYWKDYHWCYTDYNNNWDYCCERNDPYSAVNGKTCSEPCGYNEESYLWCYTTDGSWDYCCVKG